MKADTRRGAAAACAKTTVNSPTVWNSAKACLSLFRLRTLEAIQYRAAALASVSIGAFWALIEATVFLVFYEHAENRAGLPLDIRQIIAYVWLGQIMVMLLPNSIDGEIHAKILSGDVGVELCRPLDLYFHWFAKSAAGKLGGFWWRGAIMLALSCVMPVKSYRMPPPASVAGLLLFLASLVTMLLLSTSFLMLVTSIRLGITWGEGPTSMISVASGVLSGAYLPLPLWPGFMQRFLYLQPFAGQLDLPVRLYCGSIPPGEAAPVFALQIGWALAFIIFGRLIMRGRLSKIIIQGG